MAQSVAGELYESVTGQLFEIGRQLRQSNGYPFDAKKLQRVLQDAIEGKFNLTSVVQQFLVTVNYDLSVKDAIAAGKYDRKNADITDKHFPSKRKGTADTEIILVKFDKDMTSEDVLRELDKQGLRAAELPELLAFGEKYPDVQREFPIVALGSVWKASRGLRRVPYLDGDAGKRGLNLFWFVDGWSSRCRFAAVRK
jgi:hypothetical protein